jgi:predicted PurR-regulated permease PerM
LLLSVASSILFAAVRLPYWQVVGPLSGFLSLIPYIGMPMALIPPMVAALPKGDPALYLFLLVCVGLLHLFALNLLYPKFVGSRVHLNPLAVTIALMLWGMLWGGIGLILAIPITAGIKAVCDNVSSLKPYGRLLGDEIHGSAILGLLRGRPGGGGRRDLRRVLLQPRIPCAADRVDPQGPLPAGW